ncbi:MAG: VWA domain-containing protein [Nanoarchaeota archaeon]|nr:VWA domain-containing protein [Nanoarchaeota archaeon]MBU1854982.1 VWA domain-containing protein [Nanoarchaeota archaeon]
MKKVFGFLVLMLLLLTFTTALKIDDEDKVVSEDASCVQTCNNNQVCYYECPVPPEPNDYQMDVVFLIDSTGSMNDEIREVKTQIINLVEDVEVGYPKPDLMVGIVTYRDHENEEHEYLLKMHDLDSDIDDALDFIRKIEARGGGDTPEAVADGLHAAIHKIDWRKNSRKIVFLIGDAPPHGEGSNDNSYEQGCPEGYYYRNEINEAQEENIKIYTVSGSGMDSVGVRIWKEIAEKTGGLYYPLSYTRTNVDQYIEEYEVDEEWEVVIKADSDYDTKSNTFLSNNLARIAGKSLREEAVDMGVKYDENELDKTLTPHVIKEIYSESTKSTNNLKKFFKNVFSNMKFWK